MEKNLDAETLVEVTSSKVNPACYHSLCKGRDLSGWGGQVGPAELMYNGRAALGPGPLELVRVKIALAPRWPWGPELSGCLASSCGCWSSAHPVLGGMWVLGACGAQLGGARSGRCTLDSEDSVQNQHRTVR